MSLARDLAAKRGYFLISVAVLALDQATKILAHHYLSDRAAVTVLRERDHARVASVVALARDLGLRFREASMLNVREALAQASELVLINITAGTKGGRGREVDRWVPVSEQAQDEDSPCACSMIVALYGCRNVVTPR